MRLPRYIIQTIVLLLLLVGPTSGHASSWQNFSYDVVKVIDGDTLVLTDGHIKFKLRIAGLDAPEKAQAFGKRATYELKSLVENKKIQIKTIGNGLDRYSRVLGQAYVEGKDISLMMIERGLATYYRPSCQDYPANKKKYNYDPRSYVDAEKTAKKKKLNIWSASFQLPCEFRRK